MSWNFLNKWSSLRATKRQPARRRKAQPAARPWLEQLEERLAPAVTITRESAPVFYTDLKPPSGGTPMNSEYAAYRITNTGAALNDVWATIGNFSAASGSALVGLAANAASQINLGPLASGASTTAYFYLGATAADTQSGSTVAQTHTVSVFSGAPTGTLLASQNFSFTNTTNFSVTDNAVQDTIAASANKVTTVVTGPNPDAIGGIITMTVSGHTGTIGAGQVLDFSPAVYSDWRADAYQLISTSVVVGAPISQTLTNQLYLVLPAGSSTADSSYTATYQFRAVGTTATPTEVDPTAFLSSGTQTKHTDPSGFAGLSPITPASNSTTLAKTVTPTNLVTAGQVTYTLTLTNTSSSIDVIVDQLVDTLPSSPANVTYVAGSSTFNGAAIIDPTISGQTLTWGGLFTVPHASSVSLVFKANVPGSNGTYTNSAVAFIGITQIDTTLATTDNAPATASLTEADLPPTTGNNTVSTTEGTGYTFKASDFPFTDPDGDGETLQSVTVTSLPGAGALKLGGAAVTAGQVISAAQLGNLVFTPAAGGTGSPYASFGFTVSDGTLSSTAATESINVTPVAPTTGNNTVTTVEGTAYTFKASDFPFTDPDNDGETLQSVTITSLPAAGALKLSGVAVTTGQVVPAAQLANLMFTPAAGATGSPYTSFGFTVSDGTASSAAATESVAVTPLAPTTTNHTVTTSEGTGYTFKASDFPFTDPDNDGETLQSVTITSLPAAGTLKLNGVAVTAGQVVPAAQLGSLVFTPAAGATGSPYASFGFTVSDGTASSAPATLSVAVAASGVPVANDQSVSTNEGTSVPVTLSATDPDGDPLTYAIVSGPAHGTLTRTGNGTYTYTPAANYHGPDSFTFDASDGTSTSNIATVSITVVDTTTPVANGQSLTTNENTPLPGTVTGSDSDNDPLTYAVATQPAHGTLSLNPNGTFTYVPANNYHGPDAFTFTASDGTNTSAPATVSIGVLDTTRPVANNQSLTTNENTPLPVTLTGSDSDGDPLTYAIATQPAHGTLTFNANGSYTYTPNNFYHGPDAFTFTASDGTNTSSPATVSITVLDSVPPVANNQSLTTNENTPLPGAMTASDPDGDSLTYTVASGPSHGTLTASPNGTFTYTPTNNYHGPDSFTFTASDGANTSNTATVSINVLDTIPPTANSQSVSTNENTALPVMLTGNDPDGDPLTYNVTGSPSHGTLTFNANGSYTYTPANNYHGPDSFTFTDTDGTNTSNTATVSINVVDNSAPAGNPQSLTTNENTALPVTLTATDSDNDPLTYSVTGGPAHGTLTPTGNGTYTYTPANNYHGPDSFTFTANDGTNTSTPVTVSINVVDNSAPVGNPQSLTTNENTALPGTVTATDSDNDPLTYAAAAGPAHGTLVLNPNGTFTYTPAQWYHGSDSFTFTANDGTNTSAPATVSINVLDTVPPVANGQSVSTNENTPLPITLTATDPDGDPLSYSVTGGPAHGTLTPNGNGTFTYTPTNNYHGPDSFTFTASDGANTSNTATVSINVVDNVPPTANSQSVSTNENTPVPVTLTGSDPDGDPLTYAVVSGPSHGTLTFNANGSYTYTPANYYHGPDSFTFTDNDGSNTSNTATVSISVLDTVPPVAGPDSATTVQNVPLSLPVSTLLANDHDPDGDPVSFTGVSAVSAQGGALTVINGVVTYTPPAGFHGQDTFTYTISDGTLSATGTVTVRVDAPPATANNTVTTPSQTPRTFGPADFPFSDPDAGDTLQAVKITSLPGSGTLTFNGSPVTVGQVIPAGQLGLLTFTPAPNPNGPAQTSFGFAVSDGTAFSPPATMTVNVLAPTPPQITPVSDVVLTSCTYFPINVSDTFTAVNPGPYTATVNYGDGSGVQALTVGANNSFVLAHTYAGRGTYEVDVTVIDGRGLTGTTSFLVAAHFTLPQAYPQLFTVNDGSAQRSMVTSLTVTFAQHETLDAGAITLATAAGKSVGVRTISRDINGKTVVLVQFVDPTVVATSLADGRYVLTVNGSKVHDSTGAAYAGGTSVTDNFFRLFGDSNGDAKVDGTDLTAFQAALRSVDGTAPYRWYFDYDQNCTVDAADYNQFLARYGHSI